MLSTFLLSDMMHSCSTKRICGKLMLTLQLSTGCLDSILCCKCGLRLLLWNLQECKIRYQHIIGPNILIDRNRVTWPIISLKHDDLANTFASRMARDKCNYSLTYALDPNAQTITAVTISTEDNTCNALIPVTVPGTVVNQQGFRSEKIGNDPLTIWVKLTGQPVVFTLGTPVSV